MEQLLTLADFKNLSEAEKALLLRALIHFAEFNHARAKALKSIRQPEKWGNVIDYHEKAAQKCLDLLNTVLKTAEQEKTTTSVKDLETFINELKEVRKQIPSLEGTMEERQYWLVNMDQTLEELTGELIQKRSGIINGRKAGVV